MEKLKMMLQDNKEFLDNLNESLEIPLKNIRFIIFTSLSTLPFFCFLVFFELVLQKTLLETSQLPGKSQHEYYNYALYNDYWSGKPFENTKTMTRIIVPKLIQIFFLYLVPYHLLELFNITVVVDMASKLCSGERLISLREMLRHPISETGVKGPFITSLYVLLFSTSSLLGLIWVITNCCILSGFTETYLSHYFYYYYDYYDYYYSLSDMVIKVLIFVFHGVIFMGLLVKYMEWSAGWNMSLVISVVEEAYGGEALDLSAYYSRGSKWRGAVLMLWFFGWGVILRLPCLFGGCYMNMGGIVFTLLYSGLICVGNVMKWVVCVVYYLDCKKQVLEKKFDEEIGRDVKEANT